ncbi:MAG: hypothetical protein ACOCZ5_03210 [bacterium]
MPPTGQIHPKSVYVAGVDIARLGEDSTAIIIIEQPYGDDNLYVVWIEEQRKKELTDTVGRIMYLHEKFNFKKIYIDCTGLGAGPVDFLSQGNRIGRGIVEGIRFASVGDNNKIDMYSNLNMLLKTKRLKIPNHKKLIFELQDLRYEISDSGRIKIHHPEGVKSHDDFPDSLALACLYWKGSKTHYKSWHVA